MDHKIKEYIFSWIGPGGTVTGYHIDWADNIFAQIYGRKKIHLVSPDQSHCMYPTTKFDLGSTLSGVDRENPDRDAHPLFADVTEISTLTNPGDLLFIPRGWWHHVQSLDVSISVNNFGQDLKGILVDSTRECLKHYLHAVGLYGKECTCHITVDGKRREK